MKGMSIAQISAEPTKQIEMKRYMPWLFFSSSFGQGFGPLLVLSYLSFYVADYMGMSLITLGVVLTGCNVSDWAFTLITGTIVQKTNTKWGQYRPFILTMPVLIFVCYVTIFSVASSELVNVIVIASCYGISGFGWQCLTLANNGLMSKVAGASGSNRLQVTSRSRIGGQAAGIFTAMITSPLIQWTTERGINGYQIMAIGYGFMYMIPNFILFFFSKENDQYDPNFKAPESGGSVSIGELWKATLSNYHFVILFLAMIVVSVDDNAVAPLNTYYFRYSLNNFPLLAVQGTISLIVGTVAATVMVPLAKKLGKKNSAITAFALGCLSQIGVAFFTDGNFLMKVILVSLNRFTDAIFFTWGINLYLDTAEYQQWKTGKDMKAFVMGLSNMVPRIASVFGAPFSAIVLTRAGYSPATQTMADPGLMCFFIGITPAITYFLAALIFKFGYKMTDEMAQEYADYNKRMEEERLGIAAAAAARDEFNEMVDDLDI